MDYLNQISAGNRQAAPAQPSNSFLSAIPLPRNMLKWLGIAAGVVILLIIIVSVIPSSDVSEQTLLEQINLRSTNLAATITDTNTNIKSSRLRAITTNISSILNFNQSQTLSILIQTYGGGKEEYTISETLTADEGAYIEEINAALQRARIEANLDYAFRRILIREIGYFLNLEEVLLSSTKDENIISSLSSSYQNLSTIYTELQEFTDSTL